MGTGEEPVCVTRIYISIFFMIRTRMAKGLLYRKCRPWQTDRSSWNALYCSGVPPFFSRLSVCDPRCEYWDSLVSHTPTRRAGEGCWCRQPRIYSRLDVLLILDVQYSPIKDVYLMVLSRGLQSFRKMSFTTQKE